MDGDDADSEHQYTSGEREGEECLQGGPIMVS